jgi:hypothetical protein
VKLPVEWIEKFQNYLYFGSLGAFAALVGYLYQIARRDGQTLSILVLLATVVFGFYLGMLFGVMLPAGWENRDALVLLVGASGMKGIEIVLRTSRSVIAEVFRGEKRGD